MISPFIYLGKKTFVSVSQKERFRSCLERIDKNYFLIWRNWFRYSCVTSLEESKLVVSSGPLAVNQGAPFLNQFWHIHKPFSC